MIQQIQAYAIPGLKSEYQFKAITRMGKDDIIHAVITKFGMSYTDAMTRTRKRSIVECRQAITYFLRKYTTLSLKDIGKMFCQDHTTMINSVRQIQNLIDTDESFKRKIQEIEHQCHTF